MTVKKYQFYIDTKKQETFYHEESFAKYMDLNLPIDFGMLTNPDITKKYFRVAKEITVNSSNNIVKELFEKNNISAKDFFFVSRFYKKVKLIYFHFLEEAELPENTKLLSGKDRVFAARTDDVLKSVTDNQTLHIIDISSFKDEHKKTIQGPLRSKYINLLFCQPISKPQNDPNKFNTKLKYKLFLNDRLLVERFFPDDLREDKTLVESVFLDLNEPKNLKLVSEEDLFIVKITIEDKQFYPNSKEFILEP